MHFNEMGTEYAEAPPPYPDVVIDLLQAEGVIGPGIRVLKIGAGSALTTAAIVGRGSEVVVLEPGSQLATLIRFTAPRVEGIASRLEDAELADADFDSVVAATSMHWADLSVGLARIHHTLRPGGRLAVWHTEFIDDSVATEFRRRVAEIVARRERPETGPGRDHRPTMAELAAGGRFEPVRTEDWRWSMDLSALQVGLLFRTFSDWTAAEAAAAAAAAEELGGEVTEHYRSVLHLLRRI